MIAMVAVLCGMAAVAFWATGGGRAWRNAVMDSIEGVGTIVLRQAVAVADRFLLPDLACEGVEFQAPGTVRLTGLRLTAGDGFEIARLDAVELQLTQRPQLNTPLAIERIRIDGGHLRLHLESASGSGGGWRGLSPLLKGRNDAPSGPTDQATDDATGNTTGGVTSDVDGSPDYRLSDLLTIRLVEITGFDIEYLGAGMSEPLRLTDIGATISLVPVARSPTDGATDNVPSEEPSDLPDEGSTPAGVGNAGYAIDLRVERASALSLAVTGTIDDAVAAVADLSIVIDADLEDQSSSELPPSLQRVLDGHQVRGDAELRISSPGFAFNDAQAAAFAIDLSVNDARAVFGDRNVEAQSLRFDAQVEGGQLRAGNLNAQTYDGTITAATEPQPGAQSPDGITAWGWTITDVDLAQVLIAPANTDEPPILAGRLSGEGRLRLAVLDIKNTLAGEGSLSVRKGRFVALPVLTHLADAMAVAVPFTKSVALNQTLEAEFTLGADKATITKSEVTTSVFAARMTGDVGFDGALNLRANGGPLEKVQSLLGVVGDAVGAITDRIVTYVIRGPASDPTVTVAPLGIGGNEP